MMQRVLLALCISFAFSSAVMLLLGRGARNHGPVVPELKYVALAADVEIGQVITEADLLEVSWPVARGLEGGLTARTQAAGRTALVPLKKGQPLLAQYLSAPGAGTGLASRIPDGMRAVALRSDEIVGVGGFVHPGSHVDVLVTCRVRADVELSTVTALENAEVIATGQRSQPDPSGKPELVTVVTLLLTPENAERAVIAASQGSVHLVLRNNTDTRASAPNPMQLSSLAGTPPAPKPSVPKKADVVRAPNRLSEPTIETVLDGATQNADAGMRGTR